MRLRVALLAAVLALPIAAQAQQTLSSDSTLITNLPNNTTGAVTPQNVRDIVASKWSVFPVTGINAAGSTQGTATQLANMLNIVDGQTGGGTGVIAQGTGFTEIWNVLSVPISVYPVSGAHFESLSNNIPISLAAGSNVRIEMTTANSVGRVR